MPTTIASVNPATGQTLRTFEVHDRSAVDQRLDRTARATVSWATTPLAQRTRVLAKAAALLDAEKKGLARTMTSEMGKTLSSAIAEVEKCAAGLCYYVENAERFLAPEEIAGKGHFVVYQPLGAVLAVMPWNFPFWQVVRFAAPALAAGNVGLLKHASNVPQCALALESLFERAGAPAGVFQTLLVGSEAVAGLIADDRIHAVTVTGSEQAGRAVAATAGQHLKKIVLELGGSDPFVVMPSADLERAVSIAVKARAVNNGQSCIAAKRFIVADEIYDRFLGAFVAAMRALVVGDPMDEKTDIGPLATPAILEGLDDQVKRSAAAGARVLVGGDRRPGPGNFYLPTVLVDVPADAPAAIEEMFGPVAAVFRARSFDQAVALANATTFGLGASAWTRDPGEAERFGRELAAGMVFINEMVASDPRFPFGGIKRSGHGRELGRQGLHEFVNIKTIRQFA